MLFFIFQRINKYFVTIIYKPVTIVIKSYGTDTLTCVIAPPISEKNKLLISPNLLIAIFYSLNVPEKTR